MNILPHKSWHVRRKDNIAKVRKDEAEALEEELKTKERKLQYETESRLNVLRQKAAEKQGFMEPIPKSKKEKIYDTNNSHINLFEKIEKGEKVDNFEDLQKEREKKKEQEDWERKVGILTYLGQSAVDSQNTTPWYLKPKVDQPSIRSKDFQRENEEIDAIFASLRDKKESKSQPLAIEHTSVNETKIDGKLISISPTISDDQSSSKKHKKHKKHHKKSSNDQEKNEKLEKLRHQRLAREQAEQARTEKFLQTVIEHNPHITTLPGQEWMKVLADKKSYSDTQNHDRQGFYNSQFNPEFSRQKRKR